MGSKRVNPVAGGDSNSRPKDYETARPGSLRYNLNDLQPISQWLTRQQKTVVKLEIGWSFGARGYNYSYSSQEQNGVLV
jgi:hypothetical protein